MYSDYEVECLYLGRPFEERTIHGNDSFSTVAVSEKDIEKVRCAIPLLSMLVDAACPAIKCA